MKEKNISNLISLPSFFVVGTQKAGTTSLHYWLVQQPDICLPKLKETHFFSQREKYKLGIDWYLNQFPQKKMDAIVGEICPEYMLWKKVPYRIRLWIKSPKLVFIFRNPIERAFSHYLMVARAGYEDLSFYQALLKEPSRIYKGEENAFTLYSYMERSNYTKQVKRYKKVFPNSEYLFIKFDDLIDKGEVGSATYQKICNFIGLRSSPKTANRNKKSNQASVPRSIILRDFLYGSSRLKKIIGKLIRNKDFKASIAFHLDFLNQKPIRKEKIGKVPTEIILQSEEEINKLQCLTGLNLNDWLFRIDQIKNQ